MTNAIILIVLSVSIFYLFLFLVASYSLPLSYYLDFLSVR